MIGLLEECLGQCWQSEKVFSSSAAEESETLCTSYTYCTTQVLLCLSAAHVHTSLGGVAAANCATKLFSMFPRT